VSLGGKKIKDMKKFSEERTLTLGFNIDEVNSRTEKKKGLSRTPDAVHQKEVLSNLLVEVGAIKSSKQGHAELGNS